MTRNYNKITAVSSRSFLVLSRMSVFVYFLVEELDEYAFEDEEDAPVRKQRQNKKT